MVNTFLVDSDFRISASKLDRQRLGKQRVEAYQALIDIQYYRFLAKYFNIQDFPIGIDTPKDDRRKWVTHVIDTFKASGLTAIHVRGKLTILYRKASSLPKRITSGNKTIIDPVTGLMHEVKGVKQTIVATDYPHRFVLPGDIFITTKLRIHPAIDMWLGFEEALKDYINAHIEVWISRGYHNTMSIYNVSPNYLRPSWTYSQDILNNFKAVLLQKEIDRLEPAWYLKQNDFIDVWAHSREHSEYVKHIVKTIPSGDLLDYLPEAQRKYVRGMMEQVPDKWLNHLPKEYQNYIQQVISSMPSSNWWDYLPQATALTLGRAPVFEWA